MSLPRKLFRFLASLKLAVILLLSLAVILGTATYYEAKFDAKTAAHLVYGSPWFSLFLTMLGVNVLCAALIRYPWKRHQTGFVIVHLGIITILIGSFVTRSFGLEGSLTLNEGQTSNVVTIDRPQISFQEVQSNGGGVESGDVHQLPAEFRWDPPAAGNERRIPLSDGFVAVVDRYIHNARPVVFYRPADHPQQTPERNAAVHVQISAGKGAPMAEGTIMADEWLALADPDRREVRMGPATLRLGQAQTASALALALHPGQSHLDKSEGMLVVHLPADASTAPPQPTVVPVAGNVGRTIAVANGAYRVRIDRYLPYAVVVNDKLTNRSKETVNPAVELTVLDAQGEAERQIAFARYPQFSTTHHQKRVSHLKIDYTFDDPQQKGNGIDFVVGPQDKLYARVYGSGGASQAAAVTAGKLTPTGWRMNLNYTVLDFVPRAEVVREFRDDTSRSSMGSLPPAIRLRIEGADEPGPYWLQQGDMVTVTRGNEMLRVRYHLYGIDLGFNVKLDKFQVTYDPGTKSAATYSSNITVDDPGRARKFDTTITMNEPLHYAGLTFFQASFQDNNGPGTQSSTFQVASDPGVPVKYAGSILLVIGIATYVFSSPPRNRGQDGRPKRQARRRRRVGDAADRQPPSGERETARV